LVVIFSSGDQRMGQQVVPARSAPDTRPIRLI
jgi:hypothetical protein